LEYRAEPGAPRPRRSWPQSRRNRLHHRLPNLHVAPPRSLPPWSQLSAIVFFNYLNLVDSSRSQILSKHQLYSQTDRFANSTASPRPCTRFRPVSSPRPRHSAVSPPTLSNKRAARSQPRRQRRHRDRCHQEDDHSVSGPAHEISGRQD
jgi:hypothetical protein